MTDETILGRIRAGDTAGFDNLVRRWERPLFAFTYRLLGREEEARDVCQETFLRVWRQAGRFRQGSRFSTWMYQIALNLCRDIGRRQRRWSKVLVETPDTREEHPPSAATAPSDTSANPEEEVARRHLRRTVRHALDRLPPPMREVLVLKQYEGLTFREIAHLLDCPESTVKSRLYEGLTRLRTQLDRAGLGGRGGEDHAPL